MMNVKKYVAAIDLEGRPCVMFEADGVRKTLAVINTSDVGFQVAEELAEFANAQNKSPERKAVQYGRA